MRADDFERLNVRPFGPGRGPARPNHLCLAGHRAAHCPTQDKSAPVSFAVSGIPFWLATKETAGQNGTAGHVLALTSQGGAKSKLRFN